MGRQSAFNALIFSLCVLLGIACTADPQGARNDARDSVGNPATNPQASGTGGTSSTPVPTNPTAIGMPTAGVGGDVLPVPPSATPMPCAVANVVKSNCQSCHGAKLVGGAPMSLLTQDDFQKDHVVKFTEGLIGKTMKVYELAKLRINAVAKPMPPSGAMPAADASALDAWLSAGAVAGTDADRTCVDTTPKPPKTDYQNPSQCDPEKYKPLVARPGETCYEFPVHGVSSPLDRSKFTTQPGEAYHQWYYSIPWPAGVVGTRFGANFDNLPVLHHWLMFSSISANPPGTVATNVTGTTLGEAAQLLGGWAVGGCAVEFPDDMGLELPTTGEIMIQWHMYNSTGAPAQDGSRVQICTVPAAMRPHLGSMTWLGTENFNGPLGMPPGMNEFGGTCPNDSAAPITIVAFWPHEHVIGRNMRSVVNRKDGSKETVFDKPFKFDNQIYYKSEPNVVLQPGDTITSTCTFDNTTGFNVAFGQSTKQEMCYQFAFSYPARALDNGILSLIGATNTCW
jgi:hypothetical protein